RDHADHDHTRGGDPPDDAETRLGRGEVAPVAGLQLRLLAGKGAVEHGQDDQDGDDRHQHGDERAMRVDPAHTLMFVAGGRLPIIRPLLAAARLIPLALVVAVAASCGIRSEPTGTLDPAGPVTATDATG